MAVLEPLDENTSLKLKTSPVDNGSNKKLSSTKSWSWVVNQAWSQVRAKDPNNTSEMIPVGRLLELVDTIENLLALPQGSGILNQAGREQVQSFIEADGTAMVSLSDFESLLVALSGTTFFDANPGINAEIHINDNVAQSLVEDEIGRVFDNARASGISMPSPLTASGFPSLGDRLSNLVDKEQARPRQSLLSEPPLLTSTPLHPRHSLTLDTSRPKPPRPSLKKKLGKLGTAARQRESSTIDIADNLASLDVEYPWMVDKSPTRTNPHDKRLIDRQEEQLKIYEQDMAALSDENGSLRSKLTTCQKHIRELEEGQRKNLQIQEDMERKLEAVGEELQNRRDNEAEKIKRIREEYKSRTRLNEGPIHYEEWNDMNARLYKLEETKQKYQDLVQSMEKERIGYLNTIDDLRNQLETMHEEISIMKEGHNHQMRDEGISLVTDLGPHSIFQKIAPVLAEQKQYIKDILDFNGSSHNNSSSHPATFKSLFADQSLLIIFAAFLICLVGVFVSLLITGTAVFEQESDLAWWQRFGPVIESLGSKIDGWVTPKTNYIPS